MKGYIVCVYKSISDENALKNYAVKAKAAVEKYKGNFLVRGGKKITTEGDEWKRADEEVSNKFKKAVITEEKPQPSAKMSEKSQDLFDELFGDK